MAQSDRVGAGAEIRKQARAYFAVRDKLEDERVKLLAAILRGADGHHLTQNEIAESCDLADAAHPDWKFHRTRIQQFLQETRRLAARRAA